MKIDRVILTSDAHPTYYPFWNPLAKVFRDKFGIKPTLIWIGTNEELKACQIDTSLGDVIVIEPHPDYPVPVQTTWALFWGAAQFPNDVCFIQGIDEVPLSKMFLVDMIAGCGDDDYVMLIDNAYLPSYWANEGGTSPSGQHIAKGEIFQKVYGMEKEFKDEFKKVYTSGVNAFWESTDGKWGLDESYSSHKLREYRNNGGKITCMKNYKLLCDRRIECMRHIEADYDLNRLRAGWYSQGHLCRPYTNHKAYLDKLYNDIPKW